MPDSEMMMKRQRVLATFGEFAMRSEDLDEVLTEACRLVGEALGTDRAKVLEIQEGRQELLVRAGLGWPSDVVGNVRLPMIERSSETYSVDVAEPVISQDIAKEDRFEVSKSMKQAGVVSLVNVPIFVPGQRPYGILQVDDTRPRDFGDDEVEFLRTYAMILGPVIDRLFLVNERARAMNRLSESEQRLRGVLEAMAEGFALFDRNFIIVDVNDETLKLDGRTRAELIGRSHWEAFPGSERSALGDLYRRAMRDRESGSLEHRYVWPSGRDMWVEVRAYPTADGGVACFWRDISSRKMADAALRESEARLRLLQAAWETDADGVVMTDSPSWRAYTGQTLEEWLGYGWLDAIHPEDRPFAEQQWREAIAARGIVNAEFRLRAPNGGWRWTNVRAAPVLDEDGNIKKWAGMNFDIDARSRAEASLRESEARQRALIEGVPQLVWRASDPGDWTWASTQWTEITGQPETDSHGWGWLHAVHPDDHDVARETWQHASERGWFEADYRICAEAAGGYRWFQSRAAPVRDRTGGIVEWLGTSTDVDDLRQLQDRQQVLVAELQHRTFNLMGMVRSIADATIRSSNSLEEFKPKFGDRIAALARVQRLLSRLKDEDRVTFDELIRGELEAVGALPSGDGRVVLDGPEGVALRSSTVQTFAMAVHELTTNAVKYGALQQQGARLTVRWRVGGEADGPWLYFDWRETGVTMPQPDEAPRGTGQGRSLIEGALPYQLRAKTTYVMEADGVHCSIALPVSARPPKRG